MEHEQIDTYTFSVYLIKELITFKENKKQVMLTIYGWYENIADRHLKYQEN